MAALLPLEKSRRNIDAKAWSLSSATAKRL